MIYGYVRVSTDKQSTENQRFEIEKYVLTHKMSIDRWVEETVSGTRDVKDRQLGRLLKQVKKGDRLITTELSRLGRNLMQVMSFLHQCMERGIIVHTIKERYELGNNISSKILAFAFSLSAEIERNLISQRTKEALERKKEEGIVLGRPKGCKSSYYKLTGKEEIIEKLMSEKRSRKYISKKLGVSRHTLYTFIIANADRFNYHRRIL
ncbi:MAG: master DNA invertase Mpi family serine-type recombinase [Tannerellaceae bacterium]|jgi:DNA invertase Pin-like site-specific DNA recombinase|nr:master DNA invertase Mpi family serine-type recombinase [Tannerellaceae bacterium]